MSDQAHTILVLVVYGGFALLWLAALVSVLRFPAAGFGSQTERVVVVLLLVVSGWVTSVAWFAWYRRRLQDELNLKSPVDL